MELSAGQLPTALDHFRQVWDTQANGRVSAGDMIQVANVLVSLGHVDEAAELLKLATPTGDNAELRLLQARISLAQGGAEQSLEIIQAIQRDESEAWAYPNPFQNSAERMSVIDALMNPSASLLFDSSIPHIESPGLNLQIPDSRLAIALHAAYLISQSSQLRPEQVSAILHEMQRLTQNRTELSFRISGILAGTKIRKNPSSRQQIRRFQQTQDDLSAPFEAPDDNAFFGTATSGTSLCADREARALRSDLVRSTASLRSRLRPDRQIQQTASDADTDQDLLAALYGKSVDLADIQKSLRPNEAFVAMFGFGLTAQTLLVRNNRVIVSEKVVAPQWLEVRRVADAALAFASGKSRDDNGLVVLSQAYLAPVLNDLDGIDRLIFLSGGALASLPPNVLLLDADRAHRRWLDERFNFTVVPGLESLLVNWPDWRLPKHLPTAAIYAAPALGSKSGACGGAMQSSLLTASADIDFDKMRQFCSADQTLDAAYSISAALHVPPEAVKTGSEATEDQVYQDSSLSNADVIVFATHAFTAEETYRAIGVLEPALVLSPPKERTGPRGPTDGFLTMSEIAQVNLSAKWVVLVACNSGAGDAQKGAEAFSGLARAFLLAGARGVIVSYWPVDAFSSSYLFDHVFQRFAAGGEGLESALQAEMHAMRTASPGMGVLRAFHDTENWAPFVVISR
jgi:CHAT domain-containing protein